LNHHHHDAVAGTSNKSARSSLVSRAAMDKEETHTPGECHSATWTEERFRPPGAEDGTLIFLCAGDEH